MSQIYLLCCFSQVLHTLFPLSISHTLPPSFSLSFCLSPSSSVGYFFSISLGTVLYFLFSSFLSLSLFSLFPFSLSHSPFLYTTIPHISLTLIDLILSPLLHPIFFLHSLTPPLYTTISSIPATLCFYWKVIARVSIEQKAPVTIPN